MSGYGIENMHPVLFELSSNRKRRNSSIKFRHHHTHGGHTSGSHTLFIIHPVVIQITDRNGCKHRYIQSRKQFHSTLSSAHHQTSVRSINNQIRFDSCNHTQLLRTKRVNRIDIQTFTFKRLNNRSHMFFI